MPLYSAAYHVQVYDFYAKEWRYNKLNPLRIDIIYKRDDSEVGLAIYFQISITHLSMDVCIHMYVVEEVVVVYDVWTIFVMFIETHLKFNECKLVIMSSVEAESSAGNSRDTHF